MMKTLSLKGKAINYRKKGYSYNMISQKIGVNKSTLSNWLNKIPFSPNEEVLRRIGSAKLKSALFKHTQKIEEIAEMKNLAEKDLGKITKRDFWFLGIGLYSGEGSKSNEQIRFSNSNPEMIKIAVIWFKKICNLKNKNLNPFVHLYPDNDIEETLNYWSKVTGIPKKQFGKTYVDKRINKSKTKKEILPYGTLHLKIKSYGNKEFGRKLHRRIMGWIESSTKKINAGIV
ncbi:MAG: helix-turn-helix domain-containing protein [Candidatus Staskawiczbacteria bacterium]|nr:helix-turn-helix domain-containing protein [Candidatus Staskawiczbacteria bacterium]